MPRRQLVTYPDPVLRARAQPVGELDDSIRALAEDMLRIMAEEDGVGLAAPQVGESVRLFVTCATVDGEEAEQVYVNPEILAVDGSVEPQEEGCLSLPGIRGAIRRPPRVTLRATALDGRQFTITAGGLLARCWQHEIDHLDGVLIIDRMSAIDRLASRKSLRALESGDRS